jgi:hypothetical protein
MAKPLREPLWLEAHWISLTIRSLGAAHAISEWVITYVGTNFWICLGCLFLIAEFGG